ncbi:hypothetical protein AHAS_Ahas19G0141100 [Arachis hypogaea]
MVNCYGIEPMVDHYACIVGVPGRWGNLKEGGEFIDNLNIELIAMIWANLLGACRIHGDDIRHWNEARSLRRTMIQKEIQKMSGCSWIVVG